MVVNMLSTVLHKEVKHVARRPEKVKPIAPEQKYCSIQQAAGFLGVSEYLLYHEIEDIPHRRIGKRILIEVGWVKGEAS